MYHLLRLVNLQLHTLKVDYYTPFDADIRKKLDLFLSSEGFRLYVVNSIDLTKSAYKGESPEILKPIVILLTDDHFDMIHILKGYLRE